MKKALKQIVIWLIFITLTTGCLNQSPSDYLQMILSKTESNAQKERSFPNEIDVEAEHDFPFSIHAKLIASDREKIKIAEIEKCVLSKEIILRLMDYFSCNNDWKDEDGNNFVLANPSFEAFQDIDGEKAVFRVTRDNMFEYIKNYQVVVMRDEYLYDSPERANDFLEEPAISYEKALEIAERVLADLSFYIDDSITLCYGSKAVGYIGDSPTAYGWEFVFTRSCGGLQTPYRSEYDLWANSDPPVACAPWEKECLFIFVDETGLYRVDARGLGKEKRIWETNSHLLPYEEILQCIINQLKKQHPGPIKGDKTSDWELEIKKITLCSVLLNDQNDSVGYMVPAWEVEYSLGYSIGNVNELFTQYTYFNAIDGTYIEPRITMNDAEEAYGVK